MAASITDHDFSSEQYDYIIVHGMYSWVPENVQNKIFEICKSNLAANGIAVISYNTLPGWNVVKTVRDMMLYHGTNFTEPSEKVVEARRMLDFIVESNQAGTGFYKKMMEDEAALLLKVDDSYLLHDHLGSINDPCYFHEFVSAANEHKLQYVADSSLPTMFLGNQKEDAARLLAEITDRIRQEQYLDFISNRRFRTTLLTHQVAAINGKLTSDTVKHFYFGALCYADQKIDLDKLMS